MPLHVIDGMPDQQWDDNLRRVVQHHRDPTLRQRTTIAPEIGCERLEFSKHGGLCPFGSVLLRCLLRLSIGVIGCFVGLILGIASGACWIGDRICARLWNGSSSSRRLRWCAWLR